MPRVVSKGDMILGNIHLNFEHTLDYFVSFILRKLASKVYTFDDLSETQPANAVVQAVRWLMDRMSIAHTEIGQKVQFGRNEMGVEKNWKTVPIHQ